MSASPSPRTTPSTLPILPAYEERIIHEHAQELYDRADAMVWIAGIKGAVVGGALGAGAGMLLKLTSIPASTGAFAAGGAMVLALVAAEAASREGFRLRLEAQAALCQLMIQRNTAAAERHLRELVERGRRLDRARAETTQPAGR